MYKENPITCDRCGASNEANGNGWFMVIQGPGRVEIRPFSMPLARKNTPAICGENCLHRFLSPYLEKLQRRNHDEDEKMDPSPVVQTTEEKTSHTDGRCFE